MIYSVWKAHFAVRSRKSVLTTAPHAAIPATMSLTADYLQDAFLAAAKPWTASRILALALIPNFHSNGSQAVHLRLIGKIVLVKGKCAIVSVKFDMAQEIRGQRFPVMEVFCAAMPPLVIPFMGPSKHANVILSHALLIRA